MLLFLLWTLIITRKNEITKLNRIIFLKMKFAENRGGLCLAYIINLQTEENETAVIIKKAATVTITAEKYITKTYGTVSLELPVGLIFILRLRQAPCHSNRRCRKRSAEVGTTDTVSCLQKTMPPKPTVCRHANRSGKPSRNARDLS